MQVDEHVLQSMLARVASLDARYSRSEVIEIPSGGGRDILTSARTYYVATTGSDSNDGRTVGSPFLTIQHAVDIISQALDLSIYSVTIQLANGTYNISGGIAVSLKSCVGSGTVVIQGDTTTPSNVVINSTTNGAFTFFASAVTTTYVLQGFRLTAAGTNPFAIYAQVGSYIQFGAIEFGATFFYHLWTAFGGTIQAVSNYAIIASCAVHANATLNSSIVISSFAVTVTGTPAWSIAFANADNTAFVYAVGATYAGSATGRRYNANDNGVIQIGTAVETFFPGNATGLVTSGGQYGNQITLARNPAQFDKNNTTLADITNMSLLVLAGRTYFFTVKLFTTSNVASGVKFAIAGTATATSIIYETRITQGGAAITPTTSRAAALGTTVGNVTAVTAAYVTIEGTITVNTAGTITVQFADNAGVNTSSVLLGSMFEMVDITI